MPKTPRTCKSCDKEESQSEKIRPDGECEDCHFDSAADDDTTLEHLWSSWIDNCETMDTLIEDYDLHKKVKDPRARGYLMNIASSMTGLKAYLEKRLDR